MDRRIPVILLVALLLPGLCGCREVPDEAAVPERVQWVRFEPQEYRV